MEFKEHTAAIEVPKNTGVEGFLYTIRQLLTQPRIREITIDAKGKISYRRFVREDEEVNIQVEFEHLEPYGVIRNTQVDEFIATENANAASVIGELYDRVYSEQLYPIALVSGAATVFWNWYRVTTRYPISPKDKIMGLPFLLDRHIPDSALIMCVGQGQDATLIDTIKALKVEMEVISAPQTTVEVL